MTFRRPVAVDLFSGAGGLSLGFEAAGFDVIAAVEYDAVHAATHLYNFPHCEMLVRDVSELSAEDILEAAHLGWKSHYPGSEWDGAIDVLIGGPSCQGFSTMGNQDPKDERNQLILEFVRLVEDLQPRAFCMENVPGFLNERFDSIRVTALTRLRSAGYAISGHLSPLKAELYGVPQKRRRVFVLGAKDRPVGVPTETTVSPFTVRDALAGLPADLQSSEVVISGDTIPVSVRSSKSNEYLDSISALTNYFGDFSWKRKLDDDALSGFLPTKHTALTQKRFAATSQGAKEPISRSYRLHESAPALTLRAGTGRERGAFSATRPIHPNEDRVITIREAARLHSFPDWFRFHTTNWHGHRQIGNSVPPLLARAVAKSILTALGGLPVRPDRSIGRDDVSLLSLNPTQAARYFSSDAKQIPPRVRSVSSSLDDVGENSKSLGKGIL